MLSAPQLPLGCKLERIEMEFVRLEVPGTGRTARTRRPIADRTSVAIGTFDGVHLGHRQVLSGCDTVLTFHPHPMQVLAPQRAPKLLTDRQFKLRKLDALGIRRVAIVPFDLAWAKVSAQEFVESVVIGALRAESVSVGVGFRFGAGGEGRTSTFADFPGLCTRVVPLVSDRKERKPISSTRIRGLVLDGDVERAGELLGTPFALPARVLEGGRLSIPADFVRPAPGTYSGYLDSEPCSLQVNRDLTIAVIDRVRPEAHVQVKFMKRST